MSAPTGPAPHAVLPEDSAGMAYWREHFGVTTEQLLEAINAVGSDPREVREHLLNQGGSAGAG